MHTEEKATRKLCSSVYLVLVLEAAITDAFCHYSPPLASQSIQPLAANECRGNSSSMHEGLKFPFLCQKCTAIEVMYLLASLSITLSFIEKQS